MTQIITSRGGGQGGGGGGGDGDMKKAVYDPQNIGKDAFDYENFTNTPTIPTESNTKTFTLSSTSDLATAQAAYDWYRNGNNPIILYSNNVYILSGVASSFVYFVANNEMWGTMGSSRSTVSISTVTFQKDGNTIEAISDTAKYSFNFIETDRNYSTPYTPQYNGSPATKKYVDDTAAGTVSNTAYDNTWDADTTHAPSKNAVYDKISAMDTTISSKAADSDVVKLTGNQTIAGTKTFSTSPVVPSKSTDATNTATAISTEAQVYKKQDKLTTQTAYTSKGTATKVPTITTNTLGQVTGITETSIAFPVTSVNGNTGAVTVNEFSPGGTATTGYVVTKTANGYEWKAPTGGIAVDSASPIQLTKIWAGTQAQYDALGSYDATTVYLTI